MGNLDEGKQPEDYSIRIRGIKNAQPGNRKSYLFILPIANTFKTSIRRKFGSVGNTYYLNVDPMTNLVFKRNALNVQMYQKLRATTNWGELDAATVRRGLKNSLFCVTAYHGTELVGCGRLVGDDAIYFYLQDIIVVPEHQGQGIGRLIVRELMGYINHKSAVNSFVGLMAAEGTADFYTKFGFRKRDNNRPGMYCLMPLTYD